MLVNWSQFLLGLFGVDQPQNQPISPIPLGHDAAHTAIHRNRGLAAAAIASSSSCVRLHQTPHIAQLTTQCDALYKVLGKDKVIFPAAKTYSDSIASYWSLKNTEIHPSCVVQPRTADQVSLSVSTLTLGAKAYEAKCQFAIRGGG